jgi:hypothetical protein
MFELVFVALSKKNKNQKNKKPKKSDLRHFFNLPLYLSN